MSIIALRSPPKYLGDSPGPYSRRPDRRALRVLLDIRRAPAEENYAGLNGDSLSVPDESQFLMALTKWEDVESYWVELDQRNTDPGAVHVSDPDTKNGFWPIDVHRPDGVRSHRGVNFPQAAGTADEHSTETSEFIVALGRELDVDLLVTERVGLLSAGLPGSQDINPVDIRTAIAMIGLRLRLVDNFAVSGPAARLTFDRQMFMWSGAHQFGPGARFGKSLYAYSQATNQESPMYLASAFYYRLTRALHQRDLVHCGLLSEDDHDAPDAAFEALDYFMINVVAAFDVLARISNLTLGILSPSHRVGWQKREWMARVRRAAPDLADVVSEGAIDQKALRACAILRNTIHGEPPRGTTMNPPNRGRHTHIGLSGTDTQELRVLLGPDADLEEWGWYPSAHGIDYVDPGVLVERLFPITLTTLGKMIDRLPLETLPGADSALMDEPTRESASLGLGGRTRTSLLLGLTPPVD